MKKTLLISFGIAFLFLATDLGSTAKGADIINGCYKKNNGQLRIVGNSNECLSSEVAISWYAVKPLQLSEIRINQTSIDYDEYFELAGPSGISLDGFTYIVIGDGAYANNGIVESITDLSGNNMPINGTFVGAESTFSLGTANLVTDLNFENDDNVTHLIVKDFSGAIDDDLDTDDDGTLDVTPWSQIVDCVALVGSAGAGDLVYCDEVVGPDDIYVPGQVYRCSDGWKVGAFDPAEGTDSPGAANFCEP